MRSKQQVGVLFLLAMFAVPSIADETAPQMSDVTAVRAALAFGAREDAMRQNGARDYYARYGISSFAADALVAYSKQWNAEEIEESKARRASLCAKRSLLTTDAALDEAIQEQRAASRRRDEARLANLWQQLTAQDAAEFRKLADLVKSKSQPMGSATPTGAAKHVRTQTSVEYLDQRCGGAI